MQYKTVIFDFDGTVADSEQSFIQTMNTLAPEFGFHPVMQNEALQLKAMPARELIAKRLGIPLWNLWKIYQLEKRGREEFNKHSIAIKAFSGIKDVTERLRQSGYMIGVLSSNSAPVVSRILRKEGIRVDFVNAGSRVFGKARAIRKMLKQHSLDRLRAVYVGDEVRDVEACRKVGIDMIAVGWGYNNPEALKKTGARVVDNTDELLTALTCLQ